MVRYGVDTWRQAPCLLIDRYNLLLAEGRSMQWVIIPESYWRGSRPYGGYTWYQKVICGPKTGPPVNISLSPRRGLSAFDRSQLIVVNIVKSSNSYILLVVVVPD